MKTKEETKKVAKDKTKNQKAIDSKEYSDMLIQFISDEFRGL